MQIALQIENGNQSIFNALNAFLKSHSDLKFRLEKNTNRQIYKMSEKDEAKFKETLRLLEKGELEFMSIDEAKAKTTEHLRKLGANIWEF